MINKAEEYIGLASARQIGGNATEDKILNSYTAYVDGKLLTGTMPNRGELNWNPSGSTSLTIEPGYYSGGTISTENAYLTGYNTVDASRYVVLETGSKQVTVASGKAPGVTVNFENTYVEEQQVKLVITSVTTVSGSPSYYFADNMSRQVTGNSHIFNIWNGGNNGTAKFDYMLIGYPASEE